MNVFKTIFFAALLLSLPSFMKHNFKVPPPFQEIAFNSAWKTPPPDPSVQSILQQPFFYLARGNQSTVFISQDGQYVLKLFRCTRSRFPAIQNMKNWIARKSRKKIKNDRHTKLQKTLTAAHIACTEAKPFTQVIFCHLNLTENNLPTTQLHTAHRTYYLPLDRYRFALQKKVQPFKETLLSARAHPLRMYRLIHSLISLLLERSALGVRNSDPNLAPNFGFLDDQAVEVDFGNYRKAPQSPAEIANYLNRLENWLQKNAPESVSYLKDLRTKIDIRMISTS